MSNSLQDDFTEHSLPIPFKNKGLHSSFLVNFWQNLTTLWIVLAIATLIFIIRLISWKLQWTFIANVSKNLSYIPIWNFPLVLLFANVDSIVLFSALELQTFQADSVASVFSLIICTLILVLMGTLLFLSFYSSTKYQSLKEMASTLPNKKNPETKTFRAKWASFQVLFKGYKKGAFYGNLFYFFYTIRLIVPMAIATLSYTSPMIQSLLYVLISLITVFYLAIVQPIKSLINRTQLLVIEGIALIMNVLVVILVSFDMAESLWSEASILIGDLILLGNLLINFLLAVFLALKVLNGVKFALKLRLQNHPEEETAWFSLLFLPIQQGGMGFEQAKPIVTLSNEPTPLPLSPFKSSAYAKVNAEKALSETTRFENSLRETNRSEQPTQLLQDMNDEIVVFEEPEILTTTMHVHDLPRVTESSAFPIMKITEKNTSFMGS